MTAGTMPSLRRTRARVALWMLDVTDALRGRIRRILEAEIASGRCRWSRTLWLANRLIRALDRLAWRIGKL